MNSIELMNNFKKMYKNLNIPNLLTYGFTANDMDKFVSESMSALAGSFSGNPIEFGEDGVRQVYKNLIVEQ